MNATPRKTEVLTPSRLRERRRRARIYRLLALVFFVGALMGGVIGLFYIPAIRVREVAVLNAQTVQPQEIENLLRKELSGTAAFVLPKNNAFLYKDQHLKDRVMEAFPKIKSVDINLANFHRIEATVSERSPIGLWCGESKEAATPCVYFDESGVVYEVSPEYSGDAYSKWYGIVVGNPLGGIYLGGQLPTLFALIKEFEKEGLKTQSVVVMNEGDVEVLYDGDFTLKFTLAQKPEVVLEALHAARQSEALKDKSLTDLQYLDLRFLGNRLYYKLK